ncbi:hypothetical protein ZHAS_00020769 [Anopheles sinensis]|uniref:Uncharacterized protein n=1 Tax=Anopheles sinensis TaxID=74873 RepID=A0A084WQM7_ANOSI|nr:hypothetical protein ZHAS_00020769 [Anopheles sinensis]
MAVDPSLDPSPQRPLASNTFTKTHQNLLKRSHRNANQRFTWDQKYDIQARSNSNPDRPAPDGHQSPDAFGSAARTHPHGSHTFSEAELSKKHFWTWYSTLGSHFARVCLFGDLPKKGLSS